MKILNNKDQIPNQGKTGILKHSKDLLSPSQIRHSLFYNGDHEYKKQSQTHLYLTTSTQLYRMASLPSLETSISCCCLPCLSQNTAAVAKGLWFLSTIQS